jgi:Prokaryotic homologs of the JAB domain
MLGWLNQLTSWWQRRGTAELRSTQAVSTPTPPHLKRIVLADGVARTLFDDYQAHRSSPRGGEEIGWILLGLRTEDDAIALAALPAGTQRDAGAAHIRFNSEAQALASRIVRQLDKRLQIVAVVHTHPGNLRWPSDGDFQGDRQWVARLRGGEGVFAIGTADTMFSAPAGVNVLSHGDLCFCWYALAAMDAHYRPLAVEKSVGPDLALPLRSVWDAIEIHAEPLNKLCRQFASVQFEVMEQGVLCVKIALAEPNRQLRLLLNEAEVRYYWDEGSELAAIDPHETQLDRAVYLILAELAKESAAGVCESSLSVQS